MSTARGKPSIRDVASLAGVALSSVSRVLNDHPDVSDDMRRRVMAAVDKLDYQRDLVASGLRRGSTRTVGLVVTDVANPLFAEIARGAGSVFADAGYSLVLTNSDGAVERDEESVQLLSQRRVDGLVLSVSDDTSPAFANTLRNLSTPVVLLDRQMSTLPEASGILSDHRDGMRRAVAHLQDAGHHRIVLLVGPDDIRPNRERRAGFEEAMAAAGLPLAGAVMTGPALSADAGRRATERVLDGDPTQRPTAIIAGGNLVLIGVLQALHAAGLVAGQDIALVSCDDVPLARLHQPAISVISRDTIEMGRQAAQLLLERIEDDSPPGRVITLPTSLEVRASSQMRSRVD